MKYGDLPDGTVLDARVIFAPHPTGDPANFAQAKPRVIGQLASASQSGDLRFNAVNGHLFRTRGACVFCTMLDIGPCDYLSEIQPLSNPPELAADSGTVSSHDKQTQRELLSEFVQHRQPDPVGWLQSDEP